MNRFLAGFVRVWAGLVIILNLTSVAGTFLADDFWTAVDNVQTWYSPFNILNLLLNVALFSPAIGAYVWLNRRRKRGLSS